MGVEERWGGVEWPLIRGWALVNFFCLQDGRLLEVGANSRLGAYSNKYGILLFYFLFLHYALLFFFLLFFFCL